MKQHLSTLSRYNVWANRRMGQYLLEAGPVIADEPLNSSFPTIRKTLYHLWDAQVIWYKRLMGTSVNAWPSQGFTGSLEEAVSAVNTNSDDFVNFCENLKENGEQTLITFHSLDGTAYQNTTEEIILHVMNHSTYHRGQLITMLRSAGFTAVGSTDLIRFYRDPVNKK